MEDILKEHRQKQTIITVLLVIATISTLIYGCSTKIDVDLNKPATQTQTTGQ